MIYEIKRNLERRHYDHLRDLIELPSFKGVRLPSHKFPGAKRNDVIPVADARFPDGATLSITLKSDRERYVFDMTLTRADGTVKRELRRSPFVPDKRLSTDDGVELANFDVFDEVTKNGYEINVLPVPDRKFVIRVESLGARFRDEEERVDIDDGAIIYDGTRENAPELTSDYVGRSLATVLRERYSNDLNAIRAFLQSVNRVVQEELENDGPDSYVDRARTNDPRFIDACVLSAVEHVENDTGWSYLKKSVSAKMNDSEDAERK